MEDDVLRRVQMTEFEILKEVKRICEKHKIKYFLSCGTLIGAARHKGFIPWDDDVDIVMLYSDYVKFIKIAKKELSDKYFLQNFLTDKNYPRPLTKIRKNNTTYLERALSDSGAHQGIWIDILPLIETKPGMDYKVRQFLVKASNYCQAKNIVLRNPDEFKANIGKAAYNFFRVFYYIPEKLRIKLHKAMLSYAFHGKGDYVSLVWIEMSKPYAKDIFTEPCEYLEFEGETFPVPHRWDEWLTQMYGDYMTPPPESERGSHNPKVIDFEKGDFKLNRCD